MPWLKESAAVAYLFKPDPFVSAVDAYLFKPLSYRSVLLLLICLNLIHMRVLCYGYLFKPLS
jgi:hypothetical protein